MPEGKTRPVRPGDLIFDPSGGKNRVVAVNGPRLLLADRDGFVFVIGRRRLYHGWQRAT
jgi:hypothetical protein